MVPLRPSLARTAARCALRTFVPPWLLAATALVVIARPCAATEPTPLLSSWLAAQTNIHSWSANVIQTRTLMSLTQPLTATGRVWFVHPDRFRWEIGSPPQTIAVRTPAEMLVIYPDLKRAERYAMDAAIPASWRDGLSLLDAGFPLNRADLESRFQVLSQSVTNQTCEIALQPKAPGARRLMPRIRISFDTADFTLRATELEFADGSVMRNQFLNPELNPALDDTLFAPAIPANFEIVEPLKSSR